MGLLDFFKKKWTGLMYADMLNGRMPIFSQFGDNIYASDIVQSVLDCIVSEMTKLNPRHILRDGNDIVPAQKGDNIQHLLEHPNELMTKADFISKIVWNLFLNYNSIIFPTYTWIKDGNGKKIGKKYTGLYPLQPSYVDILKDDAGNLFIRMRFKNNKQLTLPYEEVIHIRYRYSFNEYMGGNVDGQPDNQALLQLLQMNSDLMQGVVSAMKTSFKVDGFLKSPGVMSEDKKKEMVKQFEEQLRDNESGIVAVDPKAEYIPIQKKIQAVDPDTLKFIDERILRNFGVSMAMLTGDYTKAQYQAFYQKKLEPLIIAIGQAFTKALFTPRELQLGHEIMFMPKALVFMDTSQIIEAVRILGDAGDLYENEKRVAFGLDPLPELAGIRMQSLNYVNVDYARDYQTQQSSVQQQDTSGGDTNGNEE